MRRRRRASCSTRCRCAAGVLRPVRRRRLRTRVTACRWERPICRWPRRFHGAAPVGSVQRGRERQDMVRRSRHPHRASRKRRDAVKPESGRVIGGPRQVREVRCGKRNADALLQRYYLSGCRRVELRLLLNGRDSGGSVRRKALQWVAARRVVSDGDGRKGGSRRRSVSREIRSRRHGARRRRGAGGRRPGDTQRGRACGKGERDKQAHRAVVAGARESPAGARRADAGQAQQGLPLPLPPPLRRSHGGARRLCD